jgi:hypothetical protein
MTRLINSATTVDEFEEISSGNICEMDEDGNRTALQSSLVYNCLWTANFCPRLVQECQTSRKRSGVILSSPIQTFKRLFCNEVFNLILEQSNIYGRQKCGPAGDMYNPLDWYYKISIRKIYWYQHHHGILQKSLN